MPEDNRKVQDAVYEGWELLKKGIEAARAAVDAAGLSIDTDEGKAVGSKALNAWLKTVSDPKNAAVCLHALSEAADMLCNALMLTAMSSDPSIMLEVIRLGPEEMAELRKALNMQGGPLNPFQPKH